MTYTCANPRCRKEVHTVYGWPIGKEKRYYCEKCWEAILEAENLKEKGLKRA